MHWISDIDSRRRLRSPSVNKLAMPRATPTTVGDRAIGVVAAGIRIDLSHYTFCQRFILLYL